GAPAAPLRRGRAGGRAPLAAAAGGRAAPRGTTAPLRLGALAGVRESGSASELLPGHLLPPRTSGCGRLGRARPAAIRPPVLVRSGRALTLRVLPGDRGGVHVGERHGSLWTSRRGLPPASTVGENTERDDALGC